MMTFVLNANTDHLEPIVSVKIHKQNRMVDEGKQCYVVVVRVSCRQTV